MKTDLAMKISSIVPFMAFASSMKAFDVLLLDLDWCLSPTKYLPNARCGSFKNPSFFDSTNLPEDIMISKAINANHWTSLLLRNPGNWLQNLAR